MLIEKSAFSLYLDFFEVEFKHNSRFQASEGANVRTRKNLHKIPCLAIVMANK